MLLLPGLTGVVLKRICINTQPTYSKIQGEKVHKQKETLSRHCHTYKLTRGLKTLHV